MYDFEKAGKLEQLAIAQAFYNAFGKIVSTGVKDNLRGQVDKMMRDKYENEGAKSFDVRVNGKKVGTYSIIVSKPVHTTELRVVDHDSFAEWAVDNGYAHSEEVTVTNTVFDKDERTILGDSMKNGEIPDGCEWVTTDKDEAYKKGTIRGCNPGDIASAIGSALSDTAALLIDGSTEDMDGE